MRIGVLKAHGLAVVLAGLACLSFVSCHQTKVAAPESLSSLRVRAEKGDIVAQFKLGLMYANGQGALLDYAEAACWYRKAADQGDADAQVNLGLMYAEGREGVTQDYVQAHMWLDLAASRAGDGVQKRNADARAEVEAKMNSQQIAEAQRRAREWKPKSGENKGGRPMK